MFNDSRSVISCTVRNASEVGALLLLLLVESVIGIPPTFLLHGDGKIFACTLCVAPATTWRSGSKASRTSDPISA